MKPAFETPTEEWAQQTTRELPERTHQEWRQLAREVVPQLDATLRRLHDETRLLREVQTARGADLGPSGSTVLSQEIYWRVGQENRVFLAHSMAHTVAFSLEEDELLPRHLEAVQDTAEWFGLVEVFEPAQAQPEEKRRCAHAHIIRRFAQMARVRGLKMEDAPGRRAAFSALLGREVKSCSELSAAEWQAGMVALRERRMKW